MSSLFFDFENFVSFAFDHSKLVVQVIGLFILLLALMDQLRRTDSLEIRRIFRNAGNLLWFLLQAKLWIEAIRALFELRIAFYLCVAF